MISDTDKSTLTLLKSLADLNAKIRNSLQLKLTSEQIDSMANEQRQIMMQIKRISTDRLKPYKELLQSIFEQVQTLQVELGTYQKAVKDQLISTGQKKKQISAYSAV